MNRHLPMAQIAREVMSDYGISYKTPDLTIVPNEVVSVTSISNVQAVTSQKSLYASVLFELLSGWNP